MLFSVIVPFRNAEKTLPETIDSLLAQTLEDWEAILIDDGSTDGSASIVKEMVGTDARFLLMTDGNTDNPRGAGPTRNVGIEAASGKYVAFCDADDRWAPDKLEKQFDALDAGADIVFSSYKRVDEDWRELGTVVAKPCVSWDDALRGNPISCLTGTYRRSKFPDARMQKRRMHEDYTFWLDLLSAGGTARGLPDVLASYRVAEGSLSSNKLRAAWEVWKILGEQEIGLPKRFRCFCAYSLSAIRKRL